MLVVQIFMSQVSEYREPVVDGDIDNSLGGKGFAVELSFMGETGCESSPEDPYCYGELFVGALCGRPSDDADLL